MVTLVPVVSVRVVDVGWRGCGPVVDDSNVVVGTGGGCGKCSRIVAIGVGELCRQVVPNDCGCQRPQIGL